METGEEDADPGSSSELCAAEATLGFGCFVVTKFTPHSCSTSVTGKTLRPVDQKKQKPGEGDSKTKNQHFGPHAMTVKALLPAVASLVRQNPKIKPAMLKLEVMKFVVEQPNLTFLGKLKRAAQEESEQSVDSDAASIESQVVVLSKKGDCAAVTKAFGSEIKKTKQNNANLDYQLGLRELKKRGNELGVEIHQEEVDNSDIEDSQLYVTGFYFQNASDREIAKRTLQRTKRLLIDQDACSLDKGGHFLRSFTQDPNRTAVPLLECFTIQNESRES